jgi:hypothetical protein
MVEIASDKPPFKTILVEMAYSVIHLHNRVNKSRITVLLMCPEKLQAGLEKKSAGLQMFFTLFLYQRRVALMIKMQRKWEKKAAYSF